MNKPATYKRVGAVHIGYNDVGKAVGVLADVGKVKRPEGYYERQKGLAGRLK